ncbi:uncharacterized protein NEMAJ01_0303 [Nematocida major]|uniref:uncharacterized protein n=1 Tax=Nematocida major TaxID=1912982 RepID=UPI002008BB77|nr:uncharacterized protein NEMAJ01_0303 [Nematocida major]KAH9385407.1 hypothetical protein NEMAJ01_0303 [Nematocida major]
MNPFESVKGGCVDPTVLSYFSMVQKKDLGTRCKALARVVCEIGVLPVDSVARCLYDTMPILCKDAQEPINTHISEILWHVLKKGCEPQRAGCLQPWLGMFLKSPNKAGYRVAKALAKRGELKGLIALYSRTATTELYIKSKMAELALEEDAEVSIERIKSARSRDELGALAKLLLCLAEKKKMTGPVQEAAVWCAQHTGELGEKWKLLAVLGTGYSIDAVMSESNHIEDTAFLRIVRSAHFKEELAQYGPSLFIEKCPCLPAALFDSLLEATQDRKLVLGKLLRCNTAGFEHIRIERGDFPHINAINCYNRVNEALLAHPVEGARVYEGLSAKEAIIRADLMGSKVSDVCGEILQKISVAFLRKENIFEEGARTLPASFFRDGGDLTQEEHIFVVSQHPEIATKSTIDTMVKHRLFLQKVFSGLPDSLMEYLVERLKKEPTDVIQEVYELMRGKMQKKHAFALLEKIYAVAQYKKEDFTEKFELSEDVGEEYLVYLVQNEAVEEESVYRHIVGDANKRACGTQDIEDEYMELGEVLGGKAAEQATSKHLFGGAHAKWRRVLECLSDRQLSRALSDVLKMESTLPQLEKGEVPAWALSAGLVGAVLEAMVFWRDTACRGAADTLSVLSKKVRSASGDLEGEDRKVWDFVLKMYANSLHKVELTQEDAKKMQSITLESLPEKGRGALAYMLLRAQQRQKQSLLEVSLEESQKLGGRILSLRASVAPALPGEGAGFKNVDFSLLSQRCILAMQRRLEDEPELASLCIKSDRVWGTGGNAYRCEAYAPILKSIGKHYANTILNMYYMAKVEEGAIDAEVFFMLFDIPAIPNIKEMDLYEWRLFLSICSEVRSIEICSLVSAMVRAECKWLAFLIQSESCALDLLGLFAKNFPILMRIFFQSSRNAKRVQKYFAAHVTPSLVREEASRPLQGVQLKMKTIAETHIMVAAYRIEESELEANISFPMDYPLGKPEVKVARCVGIKKKRLQRLLLRIQILMTEHCRIGEALMLWKLSLDNAVEEVEECGICFFMINEVSKCFPDTACTKCGNIFHGMCLKKWLQKSKNLCPICREETGS